MVSKYTLDVWYCRHRNSCRSNVRRVGFVVSVVIAGDKVLAVVIV